MDDYRSVPYAQPIVLERSGASAVIGEPLLYEGELRGVITASAELGERTFSEQDRELLGALRRPGRDRDRARPPA